MCGCTANGDQIRGCRSSKNAGHAGSSGRVNMNRECRFSIHSINLQDNYTIPCQSLHWNQAGSGPMVSLFLRDISLGVRSSRSSVAGVSGGGGRSGNGFGVSYWTSSRRSAGRARVRGGASAENFYGINVIIRSLKRGTEWE